ncbi:MAG: hypothetical protein C4527_11965 [Candidatus Omnitrophota bacterium]|jgi:hypothetical protein|nr:MAG: hypothetical protein C4527_11965 [Candidatus Omnitrophota bacterium]
MCRYVLNRRRFLKNSSIFGTAAVASALSLEEKILLAAPNTESTPAAEAVKGLPAGKIGNVTISRLICGGNLVGGYAHSRDLVYVSELLKAYFTEEKILETFYLCEENGVNTVVLYSGDTRHVDTFRILDRYWNEWGGRIQWLAQINPTDNDLTTSVQKAADNGAIGAFILGNRADEWARSGKVDLIGKVVSFIKEKGMIAGVAGHEIQVPRRCEEAGVDPDFYMKTIHSTNYWSTRRPEQQKDVIDNYDVDNYWDKNPEETIAYMKTVKKPWMAYKVLAAGAIRPEIGFQHAFHNGADFLCVGMYDFQLREDVIVAKNILSGNVPRERPWMA